MTAPFSLGDCGYCQKPIVWFTLQNGRNRSFEREARRVGEVAPADRFAYSRRLKAVVCLDGEPRLPPMVMVPHYCVEYRDRRLMANVDQLGDVNLPFLRDTADD